jgi:hypothetical protein
LTLENGLTKAPNYGVVQSIFHYRVFRFRAMKPRPAEAGGAAHNIAIVIYRLLVTPVRIQF